MLSPYLIFNEDKNLCHLSVPFECHPPKRQGDGVVVAVDLGINTTATVAVVDNSGTVIHRVFIHPGRDIDRRDKRLKSVSMRASKTMGRGGSLHKGFCSNTYRKCRNINQQIGHIVSKRIVQVAQQFNADAACAASSQVVAQERLFLNLSLEFLDEYRLPKPLIFQETTVGGLSALTYNPQNGRFYALSDDRRQPRFYTLKLTLDQIAEKAVAIGNVELEAVTFLKDETGTPYPPDRIDPEGIALSPGGHSVFISSEGIASSGIAPFIRQFDLATGQARQGIALPERFLPPQKGESGANKGVQDNLGFEALSLNPSGIAATNGDPYRIFTATESALWQDRVPPEAEGEQTRIRLLHYLVSPVGKPVLVAEHLYLLAPAPPLTFSNGLTELVAIEPEGYFLTLERSFGFSGANAKIFQVAVANATDTSRIERLSGALGQIEPLKKRLMLDLHQLGIELDNLEGMTLVPLPDGSQGLLLVSDDNFRDEQVTQLLIFRLVKDAVSVSGENGKELIKEVTIESP